MVEVQLVIDADLRIRARLEIAQLPVVLALDRDGLLDNHCGDFVVRGDRQEGHAEVGLRHDMQEVRLLGVEHLVDVGVARRDAELLAEGL